jgi:hypothetical protein
MNLASVPLCLIFTDKIETKLTSEFLRKCSTLEAKFRPLLSSSDSLRSQFEDFLLENHNFTKNMNGTQFMQFAINLPFNGRYDDFIRSVLTEILLI